MQLTLQPKVLQWARERASLGETVLAKKLHTTEDRVTAWEQDGKITFAKMQDLAHVTHTPEGYFFLQKPPEDKLPIPDFRTLKDAPVKRPSPDLLETVQTMQVRQAWMRDFLIEEGDEPLAFVGRATLHSDPVEVAADMRRTLGFMDGWASQEKSWADALTHLRQKIETAGILIVINGVVGNNTSRKLNPDEFRGFALCDSYAPLIFINGADFKSAQMFTFAHEMAHLWIGKDGVSNFEALQAPPVDVEIWCNQVAAEFLMPVTEVHGCWEQAIRAEEPFQALARRFKVSAIVAARRVLDLGLIEKKAFFDFYNAYLDDERRKEAAHASGGSFWNNQNVRVGQRFGQAVVRAAREGKLLYREAYHLTGMHGETFTKYAETLGYPMR
ncbi:MAG: ImmA/IrrE family metallo-endopeptidase [Prosthecobacter sp.]|uniref:ImmA/IrrE family metallo-endopeptidase n=1 Tax=Prosthecobacter sp. TaxID=1965333 RepID=UPI003900C22E